MSEGTSESRKHGCPRLERRTRRTRRGLGTRLAGETQLGTCSVASWAQSTPCCHGPRYCCRLFAEDHCVLQSLSGNAKRHNISRCARLSRALPPFQRRVALSGNNKPLHIKRYNESPVSPTGKNNRMPLQRGALISPLQHQKFKWATAGLFHISNGQMHSSRRLCLWSILGRHVCQCVVQTEGEKMNKLPKEILTVWTKVNIFFKSEEAGKCQHLLRE